ncbi:hypothetical protein CRG98_001931 [Punica granatum]|uniref:Uncharacterized protein n=1 Tax=Punica granatum TaxID=22663 RepID=A0A2I0LAK0_PUNGR|nr:hypothetical protein CRG98_001931 [Punica granatum]
MERIHGKSLFSTRDPWGTVRGGHSFFRNPVITTLEWLNRDWGAAYVYFLRLRVGMRRHPREGSRSRPGAHLWDCIEVKKSKKGVQERVYLSDACCSGVSLVTGAKGGLGPFFGRKCGRVSDSVAGGGWDIFCGVVACDLCRRRVGTRCWSSRKLDGRRRASAPRDMHRVRRGCVHGGGVLTRCGRTCSFLLVNTIGRAKGRMLGHAVTSSVTRV